MENFWDWFQKGAGFMLAVALCLFVGFCTIDQSEQRIKKQKACEATDGFMLSDTCLKNSTKAGNSK